MPSVGSLILRQCLGSGKVTFLLRSLRYASGSLLASLSSLSLRTAWVVVLGSPLSDAQWQLASLPIRMGGLGAQDPVHIHPQAAVSSLILAAKHSATTGITCPRFPLELREALLALRTSARALGSELTQSLSASSLAGILLHPLLDSWDSQRAWTAAVDEASAFRWDSEASDRLARLRQVQSGAHCWDWPTRFPGPPHAELHFTAPEWQALLRFRLGAPFAVAGSCSECAGPLDPFGDHALCALSGLHARHNRLRYPFRDEVLAAGLACRTEVAIPGSSERPADVLLHVPDQPAPLAVDVSLVHPLRPSLAEDAAGRAASQRELAKEQLYSSPCKAVGWGFRPCAVETTGAWGPSGRRLVRMLTRRQSMRLGVPVKEVAAGVCGHLSATAAQGCGTMLVRAYGLGEAGCLS